MVLSAAVVDDASAFVPTAAVSDAISEVFVLTALESATLLKFVKGLINEVAIYLIRGKTSVFF